MQGDGLDLQPPAPSNASDSEDQDPILDTSTDKLVIDLDDGAECPDDGEDLPPQPATDSPSPSSPRQMDAHDSHQIKMKIKRKSMATRNSGSRHEIVSSDMGKNGFSVPPVKRLKKRVGVATNDSKKLKPQPLHISEEKLEKRSTGTFVRSVSSETEPELLGPCEPGTHVCLEGCIFHEDVSSGLVVVNVTWRKKSYVGTLLDCSKFDWAPPRLCEWPQTENEGGVGKTPLKSRNAKRGGRLPHSASNTDLSSLKANVGKSKQPKTPAAPLSVDTDSNDSNEKPASVSQSVLEPLSPILHNCPCQSCEKKFSGELSLKFHQNVSHRISRTSEDDDQNSATKQKTLSSELSAAETESLEKLFAGFRNESEARNLLQTPVSRSTTDIPTLEPSEERATSSGPDSPTAYSDISDCGAPVLEKEGEKSNGAVAAPDSSSSRSPRKCSELVASESGSNFNQQFSTNKDDSAQKNRNGMWKKEENSDNQGLAQLGRAAGSENFGLRAPTLFAPVQPKLHFEPMQALFPTGLMPAGLGMTLIGSLPRGPPPGGISPHKIHELAAPLVVSSASLNQTCPKSMASSSSVPDQAASTPSIRVTHHSPFPFSQGSIDQFVPALSFGLSSPGSVMIGYPPHMN